LARRSAGRLQGLDGVQNLVEDGFGGFRRHRGARAIVRGFVRSGRFKRERAVALGAPRFRFFSPSRGAMSAERMWLLYSDL
jgi:hypothetical protein